MWVVTIHPAACSSHCSPESLSLRTPLPQSVCGLTVPLPHDSFGRKKWRAKCIKLGRSHSNTSTHEKVIFVKEVLLIFSCLRAVVRGKGEQTHELSIRLTSPTRQTSCGAVTGPFCSPAADRQCRDSGGVQAQCERTATVLLQASDARCSRAPSGQ
jgi:hypothetical protein